MYRHGSEEREAVMAAMASGHWFRYGDTKGGHTQQAASFEREWSQAVGAGHACLTTSGTAALMCAYAGLGLGPGDEVIIPGYTWIASALAPLHMGIIPVIVDIDESLMLDPAAVERAITPRTRAIDPVHMNGFVCDLDRLSAIARRHGLLLIEDACQCDGGRWHDGRGIGTIGDAGAFSFNHAKVIACGDGGIFVTNRRETWERALLFHDGGTIFRDHARDLSLEAFCGINLRGSELLAAILRVQLGRLPGIIADLHRARDTVLALLRQADIDLIPMHGGDGTGTGSTVGLRFPSADAATSFVTAFSSDPRHPPARALRPLDSGRHVYANWEPVLARRGSYSTAADPFLHPANAGSTATYGRDLLPRTLAILARTALIGMDPDWTTDQALAVGRSICASVLVAGGR